MHSWINPLQPVERLGILEQCMGLKITADGPPQTFIGEVCDILDAENIPIMQAEVIGFGAGKVYLMPYEQQKPLRAGYQVRATGFPTTIAAGFELLGHTVDAFAKPLDSTLKLLLKHRLPTQNKNINPFKREAITERWDTGIPVLDSLLPFGKGQKIGLFAGSGVGKSMLLSQIAQHIKTDVTIIALIGERGREVIDWRAHPLQKSILVVASSDESALKRRQAAYTAMALAEFFCQQQKHVLLFMDSLTRFAMAQREIGLSLGELPSARGYTPSVFSLLPGLIERAGCFKNQGSISAIYSILVEGDDFNEPLADHMRALLDGHIVLSRELAQCRQYPPISILESVSRTTSALFNQEEQYIARQVVSLLNTYHQNKALIELGAYKPGTHLLLDKAVTNVPKINQLLFSEKQPPLCFKECMRALKELIDE